MLATITGAVAASRLGIAGTIIGAAFMSLASTVGAAIYKHYLGRSKERLRAAAVNLAPRASANAVAAATARGQQADDPHTAARTAARETSATQASSSQGTSAGASTASPSTSHPRTRRASDTGTPATWTRATGARTTGARTTGARTTGARTTGARTTGTGTTGTGTTGTVPGWVVPDSAETQIMGGGAGYPGAAAGLGQADETEVFSLDDDFDRTWFRDSTARRPASTTSAAASSGHGTVEGSSHRTGSGPGQGRGPAGRTADGSAGDGTTAAGRADSSGQHGRDGTWHGIRKRWIAVAALTLGAFVIAMGSITAFEAIAGKPLQSVVWHRSGSGTTIGGLVGSQSPGQQHRSRPGGSPTPTSPASSPASSHPASTPPASPTSPVSPTPTPSSSPSPTPSGSSGLNGSPPASPGGTPDPDTSPTDSGATR
jgi:hypothetical protein